MYTLHVLINIIMHACVHNMYMYIQSCNIYMYSHGIHNMYMYMISLGLHFHAFGMKKDVHMDLIFCILHNVMITPSAFTYDFVSWQYRSGLLAYARMTNSKPR